jgi:hypothetical protein
VTLSPNAQAVVLEARRASWRIFPCDGCGTHRGLASQSQIFLWTSKSEIWWQMVGFSKYGFPVAENAFLGTSLPEPGNILRDLFSWQMGCAETKRSVRFSSQKTKSGIPA